MNYTTVRKYQTNRASKQIQNKRDTSKQMVNSLRFIWMRVGVCMWKWIVRSICERDFVLKFSRGRSKRDLFFTLNVIILLIFRLLTLCTRHISLRIFRFLTRERQSALTGARVFQCLCPICWNAFQILFINVSFKLWNCSVDS